VHELEIEHYRIIHKKTKKADLLGRTFRVVGWLCVEGKAGNEENSTHQIHVPSQSQSSLLCARGPAASSQQWDRKPSKREVKRTKGEAVNCLWMVQGGGEDESIGFSSTCYKKVDGLFSYISPRGGGISSYYSCAYIYLICIYIMNWIFCTLWLLQWGDSS
jgi:hypothetical protein